LPTLLNKILELCGRK